MSAHPITVNNVQLPVQVIRELQRLGRALEWYTSGELNSAVAACAVDGNLIDDLNGIYFMVRLEFTSSEERQANESTNDEEDGNAKCTPNKLWSFCKRIKESRTHHHYGEHKFCTS